MTSPVADTLPRLFPTRPGPHPTPGSLLPAFCFALLLVCALPATAQGVGQAEDGRGFSRNGSLQEPGEAETPEEAPLANPFAGAETRILSNQMRVWFQRLPGESEVFASVMVPFGSDQDFRGKEEIAHFLEHMLFSDHLGRTEEEIRREIEDLGGSRNGATYADRTLYHVVIQRDHGLEALDWLYRIVSPHEMDSSVVERQRQPVALELGAEPREFSDWIVDFVIDPPWLRVKGFWEREFGLETRPYRWYDPYTSLHAITPQDLRDFYDTFYVPSRMTLVVVGDLDPDSVLALAEATFGTLPDRAAPDPVGALTDPKRSHQSFAWVFRPDVFYETRFRIFHLDPQEHLKTLFIADLLQERLEKRLRFGERKAVYGVSAYLTHRGPAAYLGIRARIDEEELGYAEEVIAEELAYLREGSLPAEEFEEARSTLVRRLARIHGNPQNLGMLAAYRIADRAPHAGLPDLVGFYGEITQEELAVYARSLLSRENQVQRVIYPQPVSQGIMTVAAVLLIALTVYLARRALTRQVEMTKIRYVARFKRSLPGRTGLLVGSLLLLAILYRLAAHGIYLVWEGLVSPIPSYPAQHAFFALILASGVLGVIGLLALIPSKLLVFEDHILVKYKAYRSRRIALDQIRSLESQRVAGFLRMGGPLRFRTYTLGLLHPGVVMETNSGRGYYFRVRDGQELIRTLEKLRCASPVS